MKLFLINIIFLLIFQTSAFANSYFVSSPKLIGAENSLQKVVRELTVQELEQLGNTVLGGKTKANYIINITLMKLNKSYLLTMAQKVGDKVKIKKMKTKSLDDIDITVSRVVRSLLSDKTVKEEMQVNDVTESEQDQLTRKLKVERQWVFGLGPAWLSNMDSKKGYNFSLGYLWGLDHNFDLFVKWELSNAEGESNAGISQLIIGGNYIFTKEVHAPYVTANFGYADADGDIDENEVEDSDGKGWSIGVGGGLKFFRASTVNFAIEAKFTYVSKDLQTGENVVSKPSQFNLGVLLFF